MSLSNINNNINSQQKVNQQQSDNTVSLSIKGKEFVITKTRLKKIAKGFAKFAYLNGETNNEEAYSKELEEDLEEALKLLEKKRKNKKKEN